ALPTRSYRERWLIFPLIPATLASMNKPNPSIPHQVQSGWRKLLRWFMPGLGIKRWMLLILAGITLLGVGLAIFLLDLYRTDTGNSAVLLFLSYTSLRFLPRLLRVLIFGGLGVGMLAYGIWGLNQALLRPFLRPGQAVVDQIADFRRRERGPRLV